MQINTRNIHLGVTPPQPPKPRTACARNGQGDDDQHHQQHHRQQHGGKEEPINNHNRWLLNSIISVNIGMHCLCQSEWGQSAEGQNWFNRWCVENRTSVYQTNGISMLMSTLHHIDATHLLINMFALYFWGRSVIRMLGPTRFLNLYMVGTLFSSMASLSSASWWPPHAPPPPSPSIWWSNWISRKDDEKLICIQCPTWNIQCPTWKTLQGPQDREPLSKQLAPEQSRRVCFSSAPHLSSIGASGVVSTIFTVQCLLRPNPFSVAIWMLIFGEECYEMHKELASGHKSKITNIAHLGGACGGLLYFIQLRLFSRLFRR